MVISILASSHGNQYNSEVVEKLVFVLFHSHTHVRFALISALLIDRKTVDTGRVIYTVNCEETAASVTSHCKRVLNVCILIAYKDNGDVLPSWV